MAVQTLSSDNIEVLKQLQSCLSAMTCTDYNHVTAEHGSSLGAHVRHIIEHYACFFHSTAGHINYDSRERNLNLQENKDAAGSAILELIESFEKITSNQAVMVQSSTNSHSFSAPVSSTIARELVFLYSHTTHHMAIIKLLAQGLSIELEPEFGKSASTQKFESHVQSKLA